MKTLLSLTLFIFLFTSLKADNYYWVNGSGNWSDFTNHWSKSSGGSVFHVQPPTPLDSIFFDSNSFLSAGDTVNLDSTIINCLTLVVNSPGNIPVFKTGNSVTTNTFKIYGSLILTTNASWKLTGGFEFWSTNSGNVLNTMGCPFLNDSITGIEFSFKGSGDWTLQNALFDTTNSTSNIGSLSVVNGILYTGNQMLLCASIYIGQFGKIVLGTSQVSCNNWFCYGTYANVDGDSSQINCLDFQGGSNSSYNDIITQDFSSGVSSTFHDVTANTFGANGGTFHNVFLSNSQTIDFSSHWSIFHLIQFQSPEVVIHGNNTFDSLLFLNQVTMITIKDSETVNNFILMNGISCDHLTTIYGTGVISMPPGITTTFNYLSLHNISGTGGATFIANNSFDGGVVNGITINSPAPRNLYWVGGTGNWNDLSHWSTTSGGPGGACVPSMLDSVFIDANSFPSMGHTLFLSGDAYCKNLDLSGAINFPSIQTLNNNVTVYDYGSFIIHGNVNWNASCHIEFKSNLPGNIINTSGNFFPAPSTNYLSFIFSGSGDWTLQNPLFDTSSSNIHVNASMYVNGGTLYTNNNYINCGQVGISQFGKIVLGTSQVYCDYWSCGGTYARVDGDSSNIQCTNFQGGDNNSYNDVITHDFWSGGSCTFHDVTSSIFGCIQDSFNNVLVSNATSITLGSIRSVYNKLQLQSPDITFSGDNIMDSLLFLNQGGTITIKDTLVVNNFILMDGGSCNDRSIIYGTGVISMPPGVNTVFNDVWLHNISAIGGASFTANNSLDGGSVYGITINSPVPGNLYWVGGTGFWSDPMHWSSTSGGPGGSCIPTVFDSVFIDVNSFPTTGATLYINEDVYCKNLDLSGATNYPVVEEINGNFTIENYGSFIIHGNVIWNANVSMNFKSNLPGNIVNTSGNSLLTNNNNFLGFSFSGSGEWTLQNALFDTTQINPPNGGYLSIVNGTLYTDNHMIASSYVGIHNTGKMVLGTSLVFCDHWENSGAFTKVDGGNSFIYCHDFDGGGVSTYRDVISTDFSATDSCTFHYVVAENIYAYNSIFEGVLINGNGTTSLQTNSSYVKYAVVISKLFSLKGKNNIDTLIFYNPGMEITIMDTSTVNGIIYIASDPGFPTSISGGVINYNGTLCADYIYVMYSTVIGGSFYAGDHSVDLGGNNGWIFSSCAPVISNVWPGDANYDLIVNNLDLLYIGIAYGDTGFVRPAATNNFVAQPCQDWFYQFQNTTNVKKADSDGNGIIEAADTVAVSLNYGLSHPFRKGKSDETNTVGIDLILQLPSGQAVPGTNINIPIILGTVIKPATDVYGIAFTINFEQSMVQQGSLNVDFTNSWIDPGNNHLSLVKDFSAAGKCDLAFTRIDGNNISGNGIIGHLSFTVANNAMGFMHFSISKVKLLSHNEIEIPVVTHADSTFTNIDGPSGQGFSVYPNPSKDKMTIQLNNPNHQNYRIEIYNTNGQLVYNRQTTNDQVGIDSKEFGVGMYYVLISNEEKNLFKGKVIFY